MRPATQHLGHLNELVEEAVAVLGRDERFAAAWLEGSLTRGSADAWSDVDLHVAVPDAEWDRVMAARHGLLAAVRPVLGSVDMAMPWGAHLVSANLEGPVRVDLFLEKLSLLESAARPVQPVVLFDKVGLADRLRVNWHQDVIVRMQLRQAVQTLFFGSTWPVRLWGREEWGTMMHNATLLVFQFLVPAMLVQDDPSTFFRPPYHNERHLTPERRAIVDGLVTEIALAFKDGPPTTDFERLKSLQEDLIGAVWRELRLACAQWGVEYPTSAQEQMREYYRRELGFAIRD